MSVTKTLFDTMPDGKEVHLFTIENNNGVSAGVITKGATLQSLVCPDRDGKFADIIAGFDSIAGHLGSGTFAGAVVGQYANRISGGSFTLGAEKYELKKNENNSTCLHGGGEYSGAVWKAIIVDDDAVEFSYHSPDGENGFPGSVDVTVTYVLTDKNELEIHYAAKTDKDTVINMTNHAYFNLATVENGDVLDTELYLNCDSFTPTDEHSIPTGEIRPVEGTPFDFREAKKLGRDIDADDVQLRQARGYDHNFCINGEAGALRLAAKAKDEKSGRRLEVYTDMPGVQLYTGNFMNGEAGKGGIPLKERFGFCLETQFYPDTPNRPEFPQCTVRAGEKYKSLTIFKV